MRFDAVIDDYVDDMWSQGRFTSSATERNYRLVLYAHAEDVDNRIRVKRAGRTSSGPFGAGSIRIRSGKTGPF
jgi:hypothetical protein